MPTDTSPAITFAADTTLVDEILARSRVAVHLVACQVCSHYVRRRGETLLVAVSARALVTGTGFAVLLDRYLQQVHARHLAGESLSTRHHTPVKQLAGGKSRIRVQRSCNGCQKSLGDAYEAELDAAVDGQRLPDVRLECGCWTEEQAA